MTDPMPRGRRAPHPAVFEFVESAMSLLALGAQPTPADTDETLELESLAGDGSTRRIYRARLAGLSAVALHNPLPSDRTHPDENEGFLAVREFLTLRGVRVPAFYVAELERGLLLLEDLGDDRLYDRVRSTGWTEADRAEHLVGFYRQAIRHLVHMQSPRGPGFQMSLVPNPAYTEAFILASEARYFHDEMVRGFAGRQEGFAEIEPECRWLAREALAAKAQRVFMHRDFQSRNLMIAGPELAVIDFQGARLGPPEYDLAALLFDPYVAMPQAIREDLIVFYLRGASAVRVPGAPDAPSEAWRRHFLANAANRLMQTLGAFAKLGARLRRPGFVEHIPQGLESLRYTLGELGHCPHLRDLIGRLQEGDP